MVSVIIPALCEGELINATVKRLRDDDGTVEICCFRSMPVSCSTRT